MLKSKELRAKAWDSLKGKYWLAFAATLIVGLIMSVSSGLGTLATRIAGIGQVALDSGVEIDSILQLGLGVIMGMALVSALVGIVIAVFVDAPILIGCCGYFIKNTYSKPGLSEIFSGFKSGYGRNVGVSLLITIKLILWSLLFVIPGIIKAYEYAIIPYILADDPSISSKDAFKKAKEMMNGNKWRLFKLNFSFIGWILLCVLTCGIGAFFLVPYIDAANAEFYMELKNKQ